MREIKFRAWDKKAKEWVADGLIMDLYYSMKCNCFMFDNDNIDLGENIELMQYTGLKDKNGKEIYEGDIVRALIFGELYNNSDYEEEIFTVEWEDFGWNFNNGDLSYEVIGNIWEKK